MIICPVDGIANIKERESPCHQCGADLDAFWRMKELPDFYYNEGIRLAKKGFLDDAIRNLSIAIAFDPNFVDSYIVSGKIYAQMSLFDKALVQWKCALRIDPENKKVKALKESVDIQIGKEIKLDFLKNISEIANNFHNKLNKGKLTSYFIFILGVIISLIGILWAVIYQPHLYDQQRIRDIVTMGGTGLLLIFLGINSFLIRERTSKFMFSGFISSLISITFFYELYVDEWYYPLVSYVGIFYISGTLMLIGNIFITLHQKMIYKISKKVEMANMLVV